MTTAAGALAGIARDLYGVTPGDFIAARDARAKRAKAEGDPELAKAVAALRKPSVAAWVVNLMVRQLPERIGEIVALGEELADAQDVLDAATLRQLTKQRRALTLVVAREGAQLAEAMGQKVSAPVIEKVQGTLNAAMTSPLAGEAVRSGVLLSTLETTGFGDVTVDDALAVPLQALSGTGELPAPRNAPTDLNARRASAKAKAAKDVTDARVELATAEKAAERTGKKMRAQKDRVRTVQATVLQLRAELDELLRQVEAVEQQLEPVAEELESAQHALADAEAMDLAAQAAVEKAQRKLTKARATAAR